jgi:hypothetical protein
MSDNVENGNSNNATNNGNSNNATNNGNSGNVEKGNSANDGFLNKKCLFSLILSGVMLALAIVMAVLHKQADWYVAKVFGVVVIVVAIQAALCVFDWKAAAWTVGGVGVGVYAIIPVGVLLLNLLGFYGAAHIKSQTYG